MSVDLKNKKIEEIYQKKTPIEHILIRPDTYIGSTALDEQQMWVWDEDTQSIVRRNVSFCPGLYKIFDEIIVNAADNKYRDPTMTTIKIDIDKITNSITVFNDGRGIPVVIHKEEKVYVPTLIFGHLLTSSNFDDKEKKVIGGRNGFGAKLCNIFSHKFIVETASNEHKKKFKQVWESNMSVTNAPEVTDFKGSDYTRVTFIPDLMRFNMTEMDSDFVSLLKRRAYDIAGTTHGVKVYLNGEQVKVNSFESYAALYSRTDIGSSEDVPILYQKVGDRWEVCVLPSDGSFNHVSFVNSVATTKGGTHVNHVSNKLIAQLVKDATKEIKDSKAQIRPQHIKQHLWLFINAKIENPSFDSQTKENLTLHEKEFGSSCDFSDKFLKSVSTMVTKNIVSWYNMKLKQELSKKGTSVKRAKLHGIDKLDDANNAGTKKSVDCTLFLTEGDSAKSLAVSGFEIVGRDNYGVFPLRGKILNIRETATSTVIKNKEVEALVKIIGLDFKKKYDDPKEIESLRYGKVMLMTDQDFDGSHIKGLLINFFHYLWPNLVKHNFLQQFITPIVKAKKSGKVLCFYSIPEYEEWKKDTPDHKSWSIKYYKGLGTSTNVEAKEYFRDLDRHQIKFQYSGEPCDDSIVLAFSKAKVEARKKWLDNFQAENSRRKEFGLPQTYLYQKNTKSVTYCDFVNKDLILFSHADNVRSIPSMVDGLKPGQRKVLFTCFRRRDCEVKVSQLSGAVSEKSAYHHGEQSLVATIINLAQDFVGTNNINLLEPRGHFGTRIQGGKDAAAGRYISTQLSVLTRYIFPEVDDRLLTYLYEDNQMIEPEWYCPILPMVLVNGSDGIGTGYATKIPNYNPREIVENLKRMIAGQDPEPMLPWFKNFTGNIIESGRDKVIVTGRAYVAGTDTVVISELPVRVWTASYKKNILESLVKGESTSDSYLLQEYLDYSTDAHINFILKLKPGTLDSEQDSSLCQQLKLQTSISINQMVLFDANGSLRRYESPQEVMKDFYQIRLKKYVERKKFMEDLLMAEIAKLENQVRFILEKISGSLVVENRKKVEMIKVLVEAKFASDPLKAFKMKEAKVRQVVDEEPETQPTTGETNTQEVMSSDQDYDYLLGMPIWSLTFERKNQMIQARDEKRTKLEELLLRTPQDLWLEDLENFLKALDKYDEEKVKERVEAQKSTKIKKIKTPIRSREIDLMSKIEGERGKREKPLADADDINGQNATNDDEDPFKEPVNKELFKKPTRRKKDDKENVEGPKKRVRKAPEKGDKKPKEKKTSDKRAPKAKSTKVKEDKPKRARAKKEKLDESSLNLSEDSPIVPRALTKRAGRATSAKYIDSPESEDSVSGDKFEPSDAYAISDDD